MMERNNKTYKANSKPRAASLLRNPSSTLAALVFRQSSLEQSASSEAGMRGRKILDCGGQIHRPEEFVEHVKCRVNEMMHNTL